MSAAVTPPRTDDRARAQQGPGGQPVSNPARNVWVTETALSTALNTSYIAEQLSLFAIALAQRSCSSA